MQELPLRSLILPMPRGSGPELARRLLARRLGFDGRQPDYDCKRCALLAFEVGWALLDE